MQFLKALFWFLILGVATAFAVTNWRPVEIQLWSGLVADVNLPFLLAVVFLAGLLPVLLFFHTLRWRMRQRIAMLERTIEDLRPPVSAPVAPMPDPVPETPAPGIPAMPSVTP